MHTAVMLTAALPGRHLWRERGRDTEEYKPAGKRLDLRLVHDSASASHGPLDH